MKNKRNDGKQKAAKTNKRIPQHNKQRNSDNKQTKYKIMEGLYNHNAER